ncbi:hypothetical protein L3X38_027656 [Prunus dulcis]|uniref:Uncharacterized protein n=1 Tax=Prunus dulcis TaxID=3755 RepID=A0AAD4VND9_PRUDU|nr:hypothetical protein L3X38_027656 [Prunus dulcis]
MYSKLQYRQEIKDSFMEFPNNEQQNEIIQKLSVLPFYIRHAHIRGVEPLTFYNRATHGQRKKERKIDTEYVTLTLKESGMTFGSSENYSSAASSWIVEKSKPDYMLKA